MSLSVLALAPYPVAGASSRYRLYALAEELAARRIRLDIRPFLDGPAFARLFARGGPATIAKVADFTRGALRRRGDLARAGRYDLVLVHRQVWPFAGDGPLATLRRRQPRWVFDFDDAIFLPHVSEANRGFAFLKPSGQYAALAAGAAGVAAGNAWLADWARSQRPGRDPETVAVVPTAVDTRAWTPRDRPAGPPRLVWIGSPSTVGYLELLRPVFRALGARHPELELHVVGPPFAADGVRVVRHPWSLDTERAVVAGADIGLSPLPATEWELGKCGHKLLLYLACGLAAIASPVGVHNEIVEDGANGFLCGPPEAWTERIEQLLAHVDLRRRLGAAGRATVERCYSVTAVAPRLASALERAAGAR